MQCQCKLAAVRKHARAGFFYYACPKNKLVDGKFTGGCRFWKRESAAETTAREDEPEAKRPRLAYDLTRWMVLDTETNGLPTKLGPPYMLSLTYFVGSVADGRLTIEKETTEFVAPPSSLQWSADAERVHKISRAHACEHGRPLADVMRAFRDALAGCSLVVAHNMRFDRSVLEHANDIAQFPPLKMPATLCTAADLATHLRVSKNARGQWKWPKLDELCSHLSVRVDEAARHSSAGDVRMLTSCLDTMLDRGLIFAE